MTVLSSNAGNEENQDCHNLGHDEKEELVVEEQKNGQHHQKHIATISAKELLFLRCLPDLKYP